MTKLGDTPVKPSPRWKEAANEVIYSWQNNRQSRTMNPAVLPDGFEHHEYMKICFSMIDVCEGLYFLRNWTDSKGAKMEFDRAIDKGKTIMFQQTA